MVGKGCVGVIDMVMWCGGDCDKQGEAMGLKSKWQLVGGCDDGEEEEHNDKLEEMMGMEKIWK
jgi:hypothetical protein